ncbi:MAG: peptidase U62 [Planctomycetes bacterium]|nr:peptidase U62 [Planctomycetota bacterium]
MNPRTVPTCAAAVLFAACSAAFAGSGGATAPHPLMGVLADELTYSMDNLVAPDGSKPYYLAYTVYDDSRARVAATLGALTTDEDNRSRKLNIDIRVGDYKIDNTHQLRGMGSSREWGSGNLPVAVEDHPDSIRHALWYYTDRQFKEAAKRLAKVKTNLKVKVEEEDKSDDFSHEEPEVFHEPAGSLKFDRDAWVAAVRRVSAIAREFPTVYSSSVGVSGLTINRYMVTNEGTRLQTTASRFRVTMTAATKAEDGMDLSQFSDFNSATHDGLPNVDEIETAFRRVLETVVALRSAPLAEPYIGPAILRNRASGVFFHEIFGHRIEGHRQKDVTEGQTFTKKIGLSVLPEFISVYDDPTIKRIGEIDLRGHYSFDDEGVVASRVALVENGVLKTFLLSRSPVKGFPKSNGHGRRQPGNAVVSRQGNLIVESTKAIPFDDLRGMLVEECKRQDKPYGLLFEDISGGFTTTSRSGPQAFKVLPVVVYKIFPDGRPDELLRGVDVVGTPLSCFEKIVATGDDVGVFNGSCGAESGWIPVSAISPSILVSTIEIEKRQRSQSRPPILDPPFGLEP